MLKENDQGFTTDQLRDLAVLVADWDLSKSAAWIRSGGKIPPPPGTNLSICIQIAKQHGFDAAAEWIRKFESSNG